MAISSWEDTIVALATPPGLGAIAVIRMSGPKAIPIGQTLFKGKSISEAAGSTLHIGYLYRNGERIDEVVLTLFRAPRSYTGEDVVEISCHGSPYIQEVIIQACIAAGARLARPGEFTQRAFLHGKMDLTQAEAVADLIASNTEASQQAALKNIRGGFSSILAGLRDQLIRFSALIELELDFSQEDLEFADRSQLQALIGEMDQTVNGLIRSFRLGNVIRHGVSVAIVGKPNAGKSTLLNTLLNENRAIVSEIAGTTRDTIEEILNIDGILFRLIDTAGIRDSADRIEQIGVEKAWEKVRATDLVIYLFDAATETSDTLETELEQIRRLNPVHLILGNKSDIRPGSGLDVEGALLISAKTGQGIEALKAEMVNRVLQGQIRTEGAVITNARHHEALVEVSKSIQDIQKGMHELIPGDLLALDIRRCLHYLGEITGEITNEDQLDYIFSKFCIGK